jgi:hypothetical protein
MIRNAQALRANAKTREYEFLCSNDEAFANPKLEDLRFRLQIVADSAAAVHGQPQPAAPRIWDHLITQVGMQRAALDPNGLLGADQMLLLGEICELTDLCLFQWGV